MHTAINLSLLIECFFPFLCFLNINKSITSLYDRELLISVYDHKCLSSSVLETDSFLFDIKSTINN